MADLTKVFGVIRVVILGLVCLFSALVLIMAALVTNLTMTVARGYFVYAVFAIAISGLTLLTVPVMIALSITRKGAFPSMIVVELCYVAVLWVLWLAVGGTIGNISWLNYCSALGYYSDSRYESACMETQVMAAFSFLNWLALMALNVFLLALAIMQANRGNSAVWTSCVTDVNYSAPAAEAATIEHKVAYESPTIPTITTPVNQYPQQYPQPVPTPPQTYPQQVYNPQQLYNPQQGYTPQQVYTPQPEQPVAPMAAQV